MLSQDEYPVLSELPEPVLASRTTLYRLEPIGLGSGARESLTSYLERLADAHCVSPRVLADVPTLGERTRKKFKSGSVLWSPCFNGGGVTSLEWVVVFGRLTGRTDLQALTLAPLDQIVNQTHLMGRHRRWCPECLRMAESSGIVYTQLLWEIACVTACPLHEIEITGACSCNLTFDPRRRPKRSPGWCPRCGRLLSQVLPRRKACPDEVRIAQLTYELLAQPRFDQGGWVKSADRSRVFLESIIVRHFSGKAAWLAKSLGVSKGCLHGWMKGNHRPSLAWLIALAGRWGCSVANILDGDAHATQAPSDPFLRRRRNSVLKVPQAQHGKIAEHLAKVLADPDAPSLKVVALQLGINYDFLRNYFPEQAAAIVARHRAQQNAQKVTRQAALLAEIRTRAEQLAAEGIWPTRYRAMKGIALRVRYVELLPEVNAVLEDVRQKMAGASGPARRDRTDESRLGA